MDMKWLEDFVSLAETRSFSRSAQLRHVTQPAFSRRIQALESWAGADLIDRSTWPLRLTAAGKTLYDQALDILRLLQGTQSMLRACAGPDADMIGFAVPHTLAFTFFPHWVSSVQKRFGAFRSRLFALNVHDAALRLMEGGCDVLIAYFHPAHALQLDAARYDMLPLGHEMLAPYSRPDDAGQPRYRLPGTRAQPLPFLGYAAGAYLGHMTDSILKAAGQPVHLQRIYETDMAEGLKVMALQGQGLAFLPHSAVRADLQAGRLVSAAPPDRPAAFCMDMQVRAYRDKTAARSNPAATALWEFLGQQADSAASWPEKENK